MEGDERGEEDREEKTRGRESKERERGREGEDRRMERKWMMQVKCGGGEKGERKKREERDEGRKRKGEEWTND